MYLFTPLKKVAEFEKENGRLPNDKELREIHRIAVKELLNRNSIYGIEILGKVKGKIV